MKKTISNEQAEMIAELLDINWDKVKYDLEQFRAGMEVELEHGTENMLTNVSNNDLLLTGKIALAHLNEFPDYYDRLEKLEKEAEEYWKDKDKGKDKGKEMNHKKRTK